MREYSIMYLPRKMRRITFALFFLLSLPHIVAQATPRRIILATNDTELGEAYALILRDTYGPATFIETTNDYAGDHNTTQTLLLTTADLVVLAPDCDPILYAGTKSRRRQWSELNTPVLIHNGRLLGAAGLRWLPFFDKPEAAAYLTIMQAGDPVFRNAAIDTDEAWLFDSQIEGIPLIEGAASGKGIRVATIRDNLAIVRWLGNEPVFYEGGEFAPGNARLFFALPPAVSAFNHTSENGKQMLGNALRSLLPPPSGPQISTDPAFVDFGILAPSQTTRLLSLRIRNAGTEGSILSISEIATAALEPFQLIEVVYGDKHLAPPYQQDLFKSDGNFLELKIAFSPTEAGSITTGNLTISTNDPLHPQETIKVIAKTPIAAKAGNTFLPNDFTPLSPLLLSSGTLIFDTDSVTLSVEGSGAEDFELNGSLGVSLSGQNAAAVFCFERLEVNDAPGSTSIVVRGNRPLAILSRTDIILSVDIDVSGEAGASSLRQPASGKMGGYDGGAQRWKTSLSANGPGFGGSHQETEYPGGGGAYGAAGGGSANNRDLAGRPYGDAYLRDLKGGSGGAGGRLHEYNGGTGGGAGGGALALIAEGIIEIHSRISANGGPGGDATFSTVATGGGGSGGSILLSAARIENFGRLDADGGRGGDGTAETILRGGGGGSGGRIALYYSDSITSGALSAAGARGGRKASGSGLSEEGRPGRNGTIIATKPFKTHLSTTVGTERLNPDNYSSLGTLRLTTESLMTIDTDRLIIQILTPESTITSQGALTISDENNQGTATFCFDSIHLDSGSIRVKGSNPLALLSKQDFRVGTDLSVSAPNAQTFQSSPEKGPAGGGQGGADENDGDGPSPGRAGSIKGAGGGAGHGGRGGKGGANYDWQSENAGGAGGPLSGAAVLYAPIGGSGGAGAKNTVGGPGGGAITLCAATTFTLSSQGLIQANGGNGAGQSSLSNASGAGGGSGGSILIHAPILQLHGRLEANGGHGGNTNEEGTDCLGGGGGGGGRIALFYQKKSGESSIFTENGIGGTGSKPGLDGTAGTIHEEYLLDPDSFAYKLRIHFPGHSSNESLSDIPLLIELGPHISNFRYQQFRLSEGGDLRFVAADMQTPIPFEIERWNPNGVSYVWVSIPKLSDTTSIWAFWGNTNPALAGNKANVWSNEFAGIWHLDESFGTAIDSSPIQNNGIASAGLIQGAPGRIGLAGDFLAEQNAHIALDSLQADRLARNDTYGSLRQGTITAWFKTSGVATQTILAASDSGDSGNGSEIRFFLEGRRLKLQTRNNNHERELVASPLTYLDDQWHFASVTASPEGNRIFIDGEEVGQGDWGFFNFITEIDSMSIGRNLDDSNPAGQWFFDGGLDEVRIATAPRSSLWIKTVYENIAQNNEFNHYGAVLGEDAILNANAGPDQTIMIGQTAILNGSESSEGSLYHWQWLDIQPANPLAFASIATTNSATTDVQFSNSALGTYRFRLTLNDGLHTDISTTTSIHIVNDAPEVDAGENTWFVPGQDPTVTLQGTINDIFPQNGDSFTTWTYLGSDTITFTSGTLHDLRPTITLPNAFGASYNFRLEAHDSLGAIASDEVIIRSVESPRIYVSPNGTPDANGTSWQDAISSIASGISKAKAFGLRDVWVAGGEYRESLNLPDNITLLGGFAATETEQDQRKPLRNLTIIRPSGKSRCITIDTVKNVVLDGFILTGGNSIEEDTSLAGGLLCRNTDDSVQIIRCLISGNFTTGDGGGIVCLSASPKIDSCKVVGNRAEGSGGGILCIESNPQIVNTIIAFNRADTFGGGIHCEASNPAILNSVISGNRIVFVGGGLCAYRNSDPTLVNTILENNNAHAIHEFGTDSDVAVIHCLFENNPGGDFGDYFDLETTVRSHSGSASINLHVAEALKNVDGNPAFVMNGPDAISGHWTHAPEFDQVTEQTTLQNELANHPPGSLTGKYILLENEQELPALITANTSTTLIAMGNFTSLVTSGTTYRIMDFHLLGNSLAIDEGIANLEGSQLLMPTKDQAGAPRPVDIPNVGNSDASLIYDVGAYEYQNALDLIVTPATLDFGTAPINITPGKLKTITLENVGRNTIEFTDSGIEIAGTNAIDFTTSGTLDLSPLLPEEERNVQILFAPTSIGEKEALILIFTNDSASPLTTVELTGLGIEEQTNEEFTLQTSSQNGTINIQPEQATYPSGTKVQLTASPASGFEFSGWYGDIPSLLRLQNPMTLTMDRDRTIEAHFLPLAQYSLLTNATDGTVNRSPDQQSYTAGQSVLITANGVEGYIFSYWSGDIPDNQNNVNPLLIEMTEHRNITAHFTPDPAFMFALETSAEHGSITVFPTLQLYPKGTQVTLSPIADNGYGFRNWSGDIPAEHDMTTTLTLIIDSDKSVQANFSCLATAQNYAVICKEATPKWSDDGRLFILSNLDKTTVKIKKWNKTVDKFPNKQDSLLITDIERIQEVVLSGNCSKFYSEASIHTLFITGEGKTITLKNAHADQFLAAGFTKIKMSATPDSSNSEEQITCKTRIETIGPSDLIGKIALTGIVLEQLNISTQDIASITLSTLKSKTKETKEKIASYTGVGPGAILARSIKTLKIKGAAANASEIAIGPSEKNTSIVIAGMHLKLGTISAPYTLLRRGDLFSSIHAATPQLSISLNGGDLGSELIHATGKIKKLSAKEMIIEYGDSTIQIGGRLGAYFANNQPLIDGALPYTLFVSGTYPTESADIKSVYGATGVRGVFVAGADIQPQNNVSIIPNNRGRIHTITVPKPTEISPAQTIIGESWASQSIKFKGDTIHPGFEEHGAAENLAK